MGDVLKAFAVLGAVGVVSFLLFVFGLPALIFVVTVFRMLF